MSIMRKTGLFIAAALLSIISSFANDSIPAVGLTLSGGGAKGIAHIGLIQAFEERGIPIDCITGTSMGAIVGSLYAIGYSPSEMMQLLASPEFQYWSSGVVEPSDRSLFFSPAPSPEWVEINIALNDSASLMNALPTRLINPLPMSFAFMELYSPATGACQSDFDRLMVPLRTVASDIFRHEPVIFKSGQLSDAVRSSMSFPLVFQPIMVDGRLLYDGGLYNVYPVDVMVDDFNPRYIIGSNVSSANTPPGLNDLMGQLDNMIMDNRPYAFPTDHGTDIRFHIERFGLLDWDKAAEIYKIGYDRGASVADSLIACHAVNPTATAAQLRQRRADFRSRLPEVVFDSVTVAGCTPAQARYIEYLIDHSGTESSLGFIRKGFYNAVSTDRLRNLVPHAIYNDSTRRYRLQVEADVDRDIKLSVGGYLTAQAGSFLYVAGAYRPFQLMKPSFSLQGWMGQNYLAARVGTDIMIPSRLPSRLSLRFDASQLRMFDSERLFYQFTSPTFNATSIIGATLDYTFLTARHSQLSIYLGAQYRRDRFHSANPANPTENGITRYRRHLGVLGAEWQLSTLSDPYLPMSGSYIRLKAEATAGGRKLTPWDGAVSTYPGVQADLSAYVAHYFRMGRLFTLGISAEGYYSSRKALDDPTATVVNSHPYTPIPQLYYLFDPEMRSNRYVAFGLTPTVSITSSLKLKAEGYVFVPYDHSTDTPEPSVTPTAYYAPTSKVTPLVTAAAMPQSASYIDIPKAHDAEVIARLCLIYKSPIGQLNLYGGYGTTAATRWFAGLSLGLPILN